MDRVVGKDKKTQTKELAADLLTKCYMEYSETCGYVWVRISLNLVYALDFLVWGPYSGKPQRAKYMSMDGLEVSQLHTRGVYISVEGTETIDK